MEGPRAPDIHEYSEIVTFLDSSLRPDAKWSITAEYPLALATSNLNNIRIIKDGQDVLSHAVLRPAIVKTPMAIYKAACIGSVITHSEHRNQGLSAQIIQECIEEAQRQECDFAILWTSLFDFYRRFGFELAGSEISVFFEEPVALEPMSLTFREGANVDPAALHRLYNRHTVCTVRTIEEIRQYLKIPNSRVYTAWDSKGSLVAYAIEGKGADLDGYIHEWGGHVQEVLHLINYMLLQQKRPLTLITPAHSVNLLQKINDLNLGSHDGHLGMIKILNFESLANKILRHINNDLKIPGFILQKNGSAYLVGPAGDQLMIPNERALVSLFFGPERPSDLYQLKQSTTDILNRVFPLRLWFWGWDSI